ncbi:MAG: bifunctional precorrin-2 dehydrogenase/sirohydrochlorin ferrochelatase [Acidobacteriota bacterium]
MFLPLFFKNGLSCLVVGGGRVASHKIRILLDSECRVTVVAPRISVYVADMANKESLHWIERKYTEGDCRGHQLVIAATPSREINLAISEEARNLGIPINVVDDPELSTVIFPAIWRENSLSVAVSTAGAAPFLAAEIRTRIARYSRGLGQWVEAGRRFREAVRREISKAEDKNPLYKRFVDAGPPSPDQSYPEAKNLADWIEWLKNKRERSD